MSDAQVETVGVRTADEVASLKAGWEKDPAWDIEETEGFEAHREELTAFRLGKEAVWSREAEARERAKAAAEAAAVAAKAAELGCEGNERLARHVMAMEARLDSLEGTLADLFERGMA